MTLQPAVKALRARLVELLRCDPNAFPIALAVEDGSVVMEGSVKSVSMKKRALLAAMETAGFEGVVDRLRVAPSAAMTDAEIGAHLDAAFAGEGALQGVPVTAEIKDGVVDLEGKLTSLTHKRLAGVLAWWVPGVQDVINSIEVDPPEEDTVDELRDAVVIALEKDMLVDARSLTVSAEGFTVTLEGVLASEAARDAAEADAWFTWGVNDVINRITIDETKAREGR